MTVSVPDTIERSVFLRAPRARVFRALTDPAELSAWFGVRFEGRVEPGARLRMTTTSTEFPVTTFDVLVEEVDPPRRLSWRWHPGMDQPGPGEPWDDLTRVTFTLEDAPGGTRLHLLETGFTAIALARRARVHAENVEGWDFQLAALERHVARG